MKATPDQIASSKELAEIFSRFNESTARLEESHRSLQRRVEELQGELAEKNEELERKKRLAALGEMAAGVAHEIRNPLGGIRLCAGLLRREISDERNGNLVEKIIDGVSNLNHVIEGMLAFTRNIVPNMARCGLEGVIAQALASLEREIEIHNTEIVATAPSEDVAVYADSMLLGRAFANIIQNAIQAMEDGGRIDIRIVERSGCLAEVSFRDWGPGIEGGIAEMIFNPFFTGREEGTGLGLAIVHRIVEAHGGRIIAENAAEGGAIFTVGLPQESPDMQGKKRDSVTSVAQVH